MRYSTIGITGVDLLFLDAQLGDDFISRVSGMSDVDVTSIVHDLQFTKDSIDQMFDDGILVRDEDSEEYKQLISDVEDFKKDYVSTFQESTPDEELDLDNLFLSTPSPETTSEFSTESDDLTLLDSLFSEIEQSDVEQKEFLKTSISENLEEELHNLPEKVRKDVDEFAVSNRYDTLLFDYDKLPVKFRDSQEFDEEKDPVETITRKVICSIAPRTYMIPEIISGIYKYQHQLSNSIGIPLSYRYDRIYSLKGAIETFNRCSRSGSRFILQKAKLTVNQMLATAEQLQAQSKLDATLATSLRNDMEFFFGTNSIRIKSILSSSNLRNSVEYFYKFFYYSRKFKLENIYSSEIYLHKYEEEVGNRLVDKYGIYGFLPFQLDLFMRNISNLPRVTSSINTREYSQVERLNLMILRNSLLSTIKARR